MEENISFYTDLLKILLLYSKEHLNYFLHTKISQREREIELALLVYSVKISILSGLHKEIEELWKFVQPSGEISGDLSQVDIFLFFCTGRTSFRNLQFFFFFFFEPKLKYIRRVNVNSFDSPESYLFSTVFCI